MGSPITQPAPCTAGGRHPRGFWLTPVSLASNLGFRPHELTELFRLVHTHRREFLDAWHSFHS